MPDGLSAQISLADQLKKKSIFDAMANSINKPQPMAGGVNLPAGNASIENMPSGLPDYPEQKPQTPPIRIHLGANTKGLQGVDKGIAELRTQEQAAKDYPSSQVKDGEILPPKMHHGVWDRLKSIGKGAVIGMGQVAAQHPGAELGELLGAGAAGAGVGGVSPVSIDALQRQAEIRQKQGEVGSQIGLESGQAQLENARNKPVLDAERIQMENRRAADTAAREDEKMRETADYHKATIEERKSRPRAERQPVKQADEQGNEYYADATTGEPLKDAKGNIRYASRAKPSTDNSELIRNLDKRIGEYSSKAADLRQQAEALKATSNTDYTAGQDRDRLLKAADDADKEASNLRGERDKESIKTRQTSATSDKPDTRKGKISKEQQNLWLTDHPNKTLGDMKKLYPNAVMVN